MAVLALERLDRGLVIEHRRDNVPVVGRRLLAQDDPVAVADCPLDHRVAYDLEQEKLSLTDDLARQREDVVDDLLRSDRDTGSDLAEHRDISGSGSGVAAASLVDLVGVRLAVAARVRGRAGGEDLDRPWPVGVLAQKTLSFER